MGFQAHLHWTVLNSDARRIIKDMPVIEFRTADGTDTDKILSVLSEAFAIDKDSDHYKSEKERIALSPDEWRLLLLDGQIAGTVHVGRDQLRIGRSTIIKGDVGEVAIRPKHQGGGYGSLMMRDTVQWMKDNGFDISRLGGLVSFYSRFGYHRFPRRYVEFQVGKTSRAGASLIKEGRLAIDEESLPKIHSFDAERHAAGEELLRSRSAEIYMGYPSLNQAAETFDADLLHYVFEEDRVIEGFIHGYEFGEEISEFEAPLSLDQVEYNPKKPYVLQALIAHAINHALDKGLNRITARMPFDQRIIDALSQMPLRFQTIETYGGASSNMLQIISLKSLFQRLILELESRLQSSCFHNFSGSLEVGIEKERVLIHASGGKLSVSELGSTNAHLAFSECNILRLILGLVSIVEIRHSIPGIDSLTLKESDFLNTLFPRNLAFSGNWG